MVRELRALIALFAEAEVLIEQELAGAIQAGVRSTAYERAARLRLVGAILARLKAESEVPARELIAAAYAEGSQRAVRAVERASEEPVGRSFGSLHLAAIQALYEALAETIDTAIAYVGRQANDVFRKATLNELLLEQIAGRSRSKTNQAIEKRLREGGVKAFEDSRGRKWRLSTYTEMAARTTAAEAHTSATLNRLAENGFDLVKVSEHPHPHDVCSRWEGRIFSISGTSTKYPALEEAPPYHPNCKHILMPYVEALAVA